jgi:hypothetical protein
MSLADSLPRPINVHGKSNQTWEGNTNDSNWSAKALAKNQHKLGGYNCGKLG